MIINNSIKKQLLFYYLIVQMIILVLFGFILFNSLQQSVVYELKSSLKIILLDIKDDISEHNHIKDVKLDEDIEFQFEPLYLKVVKVDEKKDIIDEVRTTLFPDDIIVDENFLKAISPDNVEFKKEGKYLSSFLKIRYKGQYYVIEAVTTMESMEGLVDNFIYMLLLVTPLVLVISILLGNYIINKNFYPIDDLLEQISFIRGHDTSKRIKLQEDKNEISQIAGEINKLLERLDNAFIKINQFNADVSHELKTPLTIIRGELEVLLRKERSIEEYEQSVNEVLEEIIKIEVLINNLLFLSKIDNENIDFEQIYLDELLLETVKECRKIAESRSCKLNLKVDTDAIIEGNETLMKIAVKNIMENAIFYSSENSEVNISLFKEGAITKLKVRDFGIGMDDQQLSRIFDKFYKNDKSRSQYPNGSGLGMAIVKNILDMHGVQIDIQSQKGEGTSVTLSFPLDG